MVVMPICPLKFVDSLGHLLQSEPFFLIEEFHKPFNSYTKWLSGIVIKSFGAQIIVLKVWGNFVSYF